MPLLPRLLADITADGPLSVQRFMHACLHDPRDGYYATHPGLGSDFTTAPEISQMFGELIGLWAVQSWIELGEPPVLDLIELGPGRGALMADAWRAARVAPGFRAAARIVLVEASTPLRRMQANALAKVGATAMWRDALGGTGEAPAIIFANEFLDCLPIRQFVRAGSGFLERLIGGDGERLHFGLDRTPLPLAALPAHLSEAPAGAIVEWAPGLAALIDTLRQRLAAHGGRALFIDYGADTASFGDTLQALAGGRKVDPLAKPGAADLTAHVDFIAVAHLARALGLRVDGPLAQGPFLNALGLGLRAEALAHKRPDQRDAIGAAYNRLTAPDQMGALFKAIALSSPQLPVAAGFAR
jgi:NADH dehydrogenase [ubiquinone] 1 alpha subcomplex assembly factor 7